MVTELDDISEDHRPLRLRATMVNLFPTERRIVELLLAIPSYELGAMTSSDLSEKSGASRSSIDRLSRKLGYQGLKDMRRSMLLEQAERDGPQPSGEGQSNSTEDIARRVMAALSTRSEVMVSLIAASHDFDQLVEWLTTARAIHMFGAGESAVVCAAFEARLVRLGLPIMFTAEYHTQVTHASLMGPQDVAIAISHSGGTKSTERAASIAKDNGARLAVIGGIAGSPLARKADLFLQLPTGPLPGSAEVLDRIVAIGLAQVVFECLTARRPDMLASSVRIDDAFNEDRI